MMDLVPFSGWTLYFSLRGINALLKAQHRAIDEGLEAASSQPGKIRDLEEESVIIWQHLGHVKDAYAQARCLNPQLPSIEEALAPDGGEAGVNPHRGTDPRITGA